MSRFPPGQIEPGDYTLQLADPDNRWLSINFYEGEPTLSVHDGDRDGRMKWSVSLQHDGQPYPIQAPDMQTYLFRAFDGSYLSPAPVPSKINLHHRSDVTYGWQLDGYGDQFKITDPISTLSVGILNVNGVQMTADAKVFKFVKV